MSGEATGQQNPEPEPADIESSGSPASPEYNGTTKLTEQERAALRDRVARERLERKDREQKATDEQLRADFENDTSEADYCAERYHSLESGEQG